MQIYLGVVLDLIYYFIPGTGFENWKWLEVFGLFIINDTARSVIFVGGFFLILKFSKYAKSKKIYRLSYSKGQLKSEFKWSIPTILFDTFYFSFLVKSGWILRSESNFWITLALAFIWLEIWFYVSHRLLHHPKLYFIHKQHHVAKVTSPLTSLSFSLGERAILLMGGFLPTIFLSYFLPISYFGIATYLLINTLLTLYIHLNAELCPSWVMKVPVINWINPVSHHALHHSRYQGNYGLYTPFLDNWFGTEFSDYKKIAQLAYDGHGLKSLSEKPTKKINQAA